MRTRNFLVIGFAAVTLAACSSSPSSTTTTTTTTAPTTTTSAVTTTTSTTTTTTVAPTSTTSTSTTVAATAACSTAPLTVTASTAQGAAGTQVQRFVMTNGGTSACTMQSYPYISPYGPQKQGSSTVDANLPITVQPIPSSFGDIGGAGGVVTVAPGGTAVFFLKWTDVQSGNTACYKTTGFDFRAPQAASSDQKLVSADLGTVCGGQMEESQVFPPSVTS